MPSEAAAWAAIALVVSITFVSRMAGVVLMRFVTLSRRIEVFLDALSVSVVAALVASLIAQNGFRETAAVVTASIMMLVFKSPAAAMVSGMTIAGCWAAFGWG